MPIFENNCKAWAVMKSRFLLVSLAAALALSLIVLIVGQISANPFHFCLQQQSSLTLQSTPQPTHASSFPPNLAPINRSNIGHLVQMGALQNNWNAFFISLDLSGELAAIGDGGNIHLLRIREHGVTKFNAEIGTFFAGMVFTVNHNLLALIGNSDGRDRLNDEFQLIDLTSGKKLQLLHLKKGEMINDIAIMPNEECLVLGSSSRSVQFWNLQSGQTAILAARSLVSTIDFSSDGKLLAYGTDGDNDSVGPTIVVIWNLEINKEIKVFRDQRDRISEVKFSNDGKTLASASFDGTVHLWNVDTGDNLAILQGHTKRASAVAFSQDDKLLATGSQDGKIYLWNTDTWQLVETVQIPRQVIKLGFSFDTNFLISADDNGNLYYWGTLSQSGNSSSK
jgi:hypothetical protein